MKSLLGFVLIAIAMAQMDDDDDDKMMKGMCYGLNEYIWPMCGFFPWRVVGDWYVIWEAADKDSDDYSTSCQQYRFDATDDLFRHNVYYQGTYTWEEDGVEMSESVVNLPSSTDSYSQYNKNSWGKGYNQSPGMYGGVVNFRVIDSDLENWALIYTCDDHPRSTPYPLNYYDMDDMDMDDMDMDDMDMDGMEDMMDDMDMADMPRKGKMIDVMLIGSSPDILSDKDIKKQINASILKMTGEKVSSKDVMTVDHSDCTYNSDMA